MSQNSVMSIEWPCKHFRPEELLSVDGMALYEQGILMLQLDFIRKLDRFRDHLSRPLLINYAGMRNRGYRSSKENESIDGAKYSRHVQGIAIDVTVPTFTPEQVAEEAIMFGFRYAKSYSTWCHIDEGVRG